jgi:hypothetical protein
MKVLSRIAATSAGLLLLSFGAGQSLAADETAEAGWRQVAYSCESGQALTVDYRDSGSAAKVTGADKPVVKLISRPAKSGFRFGDSRHELRGDGDAVTWQVGSKTPVKCTTTTRAATTVVPAGNY